MHGLIFPVTTIYNFANRKKANFTFQCKGMEWHCFRNISAIVSHLSHCHFEPTISCELTSHGRPDILDRVLNTNKASEFFQVREVSSF